MRLIDAEVFEELFYKQMELGANGFEAAEDALHDTPTVDAEPVRHSYWIGWEYDGYADGFPVFDTWLCNECGSDFRSEGEPPAFDYCPTCGARMDGEEHDSC